MINSASLTAPIAALKRRRVAASVTVPAAGRKIFPASSVENVAARLFSHFRLTPLENRLDETHTHILFRFITRTNA